MEDEDGYWSYCIMFKAVYLRKAPTHFGSDKIYNVMINKLKKSLKNKGVPFVNTYHPKLTIRQEKKLDNYRDYPQYYPIPK
jgi:hypothetical protein